MIFHKRRQQATALRFKQQNFHQTCGDRRPRRSIYVKSPTALPLVLQVPPPARAGAKGNIAPNKRDAEDVVPTKFGANFNILIVGEDIILPLILRQFFWREPLPYGH